MSKQEYEVQRKFIGWETCTVEATSYDEAVELAEQQDGWYDATDSYLATEDYWVNNRDTKEARVKREGEDWESAI